jgi:hypothetical protein
VSAEPRHVEYEVRSPADVSGPAKMAGYALYYVCEGIQGQCLYRRQDLTVELRVQH